MKRCPECRRDYYDGTLLYCLDDGNALLEGPATGSSSDEPATAILHVAETPGDAAARAQIHMTEQTAVLPTGTGDVNPRPRRLDKRLLAIPLLLAIIALVGFFGYRSFKPASGGPINSIAVLPFQNRSDDADTDYLSDGLAESLIFRLSQFRGLKVSPTSSVMHYKGNAADPTAIAKSLGVDAVMTGRLMKRGDSLNISVELVDIRTNTSLWGEQYERKISDLLATQREIATTVIQKLRPKLSGVEPGITKKYTDNNDAYQLYLKARFMFAKRTKDDINKSIRLYQQAVELDSNFALAYAGLAEAYVVIPSFSYASPAECLPKAKEYNTKALELDPELSEAHTVAGVIAAMYEWDWQKAEPEFKRAIELDPDLAVAHFRYAWTYLSPLGRHDEAIAEMKIAIDREPLLLIQNTQYGAILSYARRYDEALEHLRRTRELDENFVNVKNWLCRVYNLKGMYAESLGISEPTLDTDEPMFNDAAYAFAMTGQRAKALAMLSRIKDREKRRYVSNYNIAAVYVALGDKDAAFAEMEKAYQARDWTLPRVKVDPLMDPLRDDPRFDAMVKRLNLP